MNHVSVVTSQNISIDYDVAGIGERIAARIIDLALFFVIYLLFVVIIASTGLIISDGGTIALLIVFGVLFVFYDLLCEAMLNGQSIGKRLLKIKVISLDGYQPSLGQYFLRWIFRLVDFTMTAQIGGLICAAVTPNKQRIGDLVAGTTLIRTVPRTKLEAVVFRPLVEQDNYDPIFPEVAQLSDADVTLIHEVIGNFNRSGNNMLIYRMAMKVKDTLHVELKDGMDELQFLRAVIKDYNYITSRI